MNIRNVKTDCVPQAVGQEAENDHPEDSRV